MLDLDYVRKNYSQLSDQKIMHLANFEANQLEPEVVEILLEEIKKRNLDLKLIEAVKVSTKELHEDELQKYISIIQSLPDPTTGETGSVINATIVSFTFSVILFTRKKDSVFFGNNKSIHNKLNDCTMTTAAAGWWGIPWGLFYSISSLRNNIRMGKIDYNEKPTDILIQYVIENVGFIENNQNNPTELVNHLKKIME